ncbi:DUF371 domain-containing protein [Candidatus Woesearchaeota archaeon]|nr:DUF371 domain-containing protein [Candidatus Woesearchaeota archaeon]
MQYKFRAYGHPNILGTHKTTLEFTKDDELSLKGGCIVGVKADFNLNKIKGFIKKMPNKKITITIEVIDEENKRVKEKISAELNPGFNDDKELVIRKTDFMSERTLAIKADKAAFELNRGLIESLKQKKVVIAVVFEFA